MNAQFFAYLNLAASVCMYVCMCVGTGVLLNGVASLQLPFSRRETGGQVAVKEMKEYGRLLEEAVQRGRICVDVEGGTGGEGTQSTLCALTLPKHWTLFMKKVCDSFSKVYIYCA